MNILITYILKLLTELKGAKESEKEVKRKELVDLLTGEVNLHSNKELIEKFIAEKLSIIHDTDNIPQEFEKYWTREQEKAFKQFVDEENLVCVKRQKSCLRTTYMQSESHCETT